jgi:hypothetical protein
LAVNTESCIFVPYKNKEIMTTQEIFAGITTAELISYKIAGDNSKELRQEIERRISIEAASRKGKVNNTELDAKYNG